jgi:hypothetical protein
MNDVNTATAAPRFSMRDRMAMYNANALKIGLFGSNCSSGRAVTLVPERWTGNWEDNLALAKMSDAAGIEFMLPVGRWKGYGGDTDYMGTSLETITWATGLLSHTKRLIVFGTVHAPLFHPLIAAKQFVTADHVSEGRFGLNIVVGWNEDEFQMFGVTQREHDARGKNNRIDRIHRHRGMSATPINDDGDGIRHGTERPRVIANGPSRHCVVIV